MARKLIFRDEKGNRFGEFPHDAAQGFIAGRRGIRRKLCGPEALIGLSDEQITIKLSTIYKAVVFQYTDDLILKDFKFKEKEIKRSVELFSLAARKYLLEVDPNSSSTTYKDYKRSLDLFTKVVGDFKLRRFSRERHNIAFYNFLSSPLAYKGKPYSRDTQNKHQRHVQIFLNWCFESGRLKVAIKLKTTKRVDRDMDTLSISQLDTLRQHLEKRIISAVDYRNSLKNGLSKLHANAHALNFKNLLRSLLLGQHTLLRAGAMWSLKLDKIDFKNEIIKIRDNPELNWVNKWGKWPDKPINKLLLDILKDDLENRSEKERYFLDNGNGQPWFHRPSVASTLMGEEMQLAGLPKIDKPYHWGIRATMCTELLLSGENIIFVQCLMDHSDINTTLKYMNTRKINQADAVKSISQLVSTDKEPLKNQNTNLISELLKY